MRDRLSTEQLAKFKRGHDVGILAQKLFPGGVDLSPESPLKYDKAIQQTAKHIKKKTPVIFEAAFQYNGVLAALDILVFKENGWYAYEVKSSLSISHTFLLDASLQYYVIRNSGVELKEFNIIYVNESYVKNDNLELSLLFNIENVTTQVRNNEEFVNSKVEIFKKVVSGYKEPDIDIGEHCDIPYTCDYKGYCWNKIPAKGSVFSLDKLSKKERFELYKYSLVKINSIPDSYPLSNEVRFQINLYKKKKIWNDDLKFAQFISRVKYPVCIIHIAVNNPAIPLFPGNRPYQQLPFAAGILYQKSENDKPKYSYFIDEPINDPTFHCLEFLTEHSTGSKSIIVFSDIKEWSCFDCIHTISDKKEILNNIKEKTINLYEPFTNLYHYNPKIGFDYKIENIIKSISENGLSRTIIKNDTELSDAYAQLRTDTDIFRISEIKANIEDYIKVATDYDYQILKYLESKLE
ncbi:MAG: DUF2779 domain-containing protein [Bacteroidota bacterium]|nr:DUF2779 domain-containing protein [Bacteroidota bacterium]